VLESFIQENLGKKECSSHVISLSRHHMVKPKARPGSPLAAFGIAAPLTIKTLQRWRKKC